MREEKYIPDTIVPLIVEIPPSLFYFIYFPDQSGFARQKWYLVLTKVGQDFTMVERVSYEPSVRLVQSETVAGMIETGATNFLIAGGKDIYFLETAQVYDRVKKAYVNPSIDEKFLSTWDEQAKPLSVIANEHFVAYLQYDAGQKKVRDLSTGATTTIGKNAEVFMVTDGTNSITMFKTSTAMNIYFNTSDISTEAQDSIDTNFTSTCYILSSTQFAVMLDGMLRIFSPAGTLQSTISYTYPYKAGLVKFLETKEQNGQTKGQIYLVNAYDAIDLGDGEYIVQKVSLDKLRSDFEIQETTKVFDVFVLSGWPKAITALPYQKASYTGWIDEDEEQGEGGGVAV